MKRFVLAFGISCAFSMFGGTVSAADSGKTVYTVPSDIHWLPLTGKGIPVGATYAVLRGKESDSCDWATMNKFPDGFVFPMHVNHAYLLFTIVEGTLVIGFDKGHLKSSERVLPAGSFMQGLATEPHYGRAIGETIFEIYAPCPEK